MQVAKLNSSLTSRLLNHLFPKVCECCHTPLKGDELVLCLNCEYELNHDFPIVPLLDISELFWGKADIAAAYSLFIYRQGSKLQHLLHQIKYHGKSRLIPYFGSKLYETIILHPELREVSCITFPPGSKKNQRKRGYNQAEELCKSIHKLTGIPYTELFKNKGRSNSQTNKNVHDRHVSLSGSITIDKKQLMKIGLGRILLIDDVVTTGATLSECGKLLENAGVKEIFVLSIAHRGW